jgi:hypothetical protein
VVWGCCRDAMAAVIIIQLCCIVFNCVVLCCVVLCCVVLCCVVCGWQAEAETVAQYIENSADVGELKDQMEACDTVLARMQEMLLGENLLCSCHVYVSTLLLLLVYMCTCDRFPSGLRRNI